MCLQFLRLLASSSGLLACTLPTLDSASSVDSEIQQNNWHQKQDQQYTILLFSSICLHCYLKKAFLSLLAILWNSAFNWVYLSLSPLPFVSLLFSAICKASSDNHFTVLHCFFCGWLWSLTTVQCFFGMILITVSYIMLQTSASYFFRHSVYQI